VDAVLTLQTLFYGSRQAKEEGLVSPTPGQHSKLVGRGKYVHEKVTHAVIPSHKEAYLKAAEKFFRAIMERGDELGGVKLTGSWETVIGSVGDFTHILEYEGYKGYDTTMRDLRADKVCQAPDKKCFCSLTTAGVAIPHQRHPPSHHLAPTPDHLGILLLAFFAPARFGLPGGGSIRDEELPAPAGQTARVGGGLEKRSRGEKAVCGTLSSSTLGEIWSDSHSNLSEPSSPRLDNCTRCTTSGSTRKSGLGMPLSLS
jgi:hypothetical protein